MSLHLKLDHISYRSNCAHVAVGPLTPLKHMRERAGSGASRRHGMESAVTLNGFTFVCAESDEKGGGLCVCVFFLR